MNDVETTAIVLSSLNYNDLQKMYNTSSYYLNFKNHPLLVDKLNFVNKVLNYVLDHSIVDNADPHPSQIINNYGTSFFAYHLTKKDIAQQIYSMHVKRSQEYLSNTTEIKIINIAYGLWDQKYQMVIAQRGLIDYIYATREQLYHFLFPLIYDNKLFPNLG